MSVRGTRNPIAAFTLAGIVLVSQAKVSFAEAPTASAVARSPQVQMDSSEKLARAARDPVSAGVAAVSAAADALKSQGPAAAIDYFTKALNDVKNDAIKRAIRFELIELYRANNEPDKALAAATSLMTDATENDEMRGNGGPGMGGPPGMGGGGMPGGQGGPPDQQR